MEHPPNDYKVRPNQHENSHKLCNENSVLSLLESQWKLRQQHQSFPMKGRPV